MNAPRLIDTTGCEHGTLQVETFPKGLYANQEKRPDGNDEGVKRIAVERDREEILQWCSDAGALDSDDEEEVLDQVVESLEPHKDGYALAKALEDDHQWEPDSALVDILDTLQDTLRSVTQEAVVAWVRDRGLQPKHALGAKIQARVGWSWHDGVVVKVYPERMEYVVAVPSKGQKVPDPIDPERAAGYVVSEDDTRVPE